MSLQRTPREQIPVVILCGGLGTRLREETERVPKPLVAIGDKPILWHIMKIYAHHGFRRFILCLGYKSWLIKEFFLRYREVVSDFTLELSNDHQPDFHDNGGDEDWTVTCAETGLHTYTGARLRRVRDYIDTETFMLTYGDGIGEVDIGRLLDFHYDEGRTGTVTGVHPVARYGEMRVDSGKAVEFAEKPLIEGFVSGGFFVFQRQFLDYLNDDPNLWLEGPPLENLARDGELSVYPHDGYWLGMDTYRDLTELTDLWDTGDAPWKVWDD
jgi:glucose-1-phosphate cytidylyltransferase